MDDGIAAGTLNVMATAHIIVWGEKDAGEQQWRGRINHETQLNPVFYAYLDKLALELLNGKLGDGSWYVLWGTGTGPAGNPRCVYV
jgi:hypothetical protein